MLSEIVSAGLLELKTQSAASRVCRPNPGGDTQLLWQPGAHHHPSVCVCAYHWTAPLLQCTFKVEEELGLYEGSLSWGNLWKKSSMLWTLQEKQQQKDQVHSQGIYWMDEIVLVWAYTFFLFCFFLWVCSVLVLTLWCLLVTTYG